MGVGGAGVGAARGGVGQADGSLDRTHEGRGRGLPLVAALAELHGAGLKLDSEPGVGTTATVVFPARRTIAGPASADRRTRQSVA